jgi:RpiR family carbohydrate utilization transcriptional regulator
MILATIKNKIDHLSKSERRVALTLLESPDTVVVQNISYLAKLARVSEPTVVRFCRSMGFDGWQEFKLKLAQNIVLDISSEDSQPKAADMTADLCLKICNRSINALLDLRQFLDPLRLDAALDLLARSKKIEIYGHGSSAHVASDAQHKFFRCGVPVVAYADPYVHSISASLLTPDDALLVISQRGNNANLLRSVQLAAQAGANIVVIAPSNSSLARHATVMLSVDLPLNANDIYTPITARLAHLVIIDILAVGLAIRQGRHLRNKHLKMQQQLGEFDIQFETFLNR